MKITTTRESAEVMGHTLATVIALTKASTEIASRLSSLDERVQKLEGLTKSESLNDEQED